jgi:hypothetical protein
MKSFFISLTFVLLISVISRAQTAEDSVKAAVNLLFTAMKSSDPVMLKSAFADSAILQTIARNGKKKGSFVVAAESVSDFASVIEKLPKDSADERITFETIKIDGPLAIVWTPYKFYFNGKFSHCGVNSFQLVRLDGIWKIQYLIDTRRVTGCDK